MEKSGLDYQLKPFTPGARKKAIKTTKLYFRDTGLCCYLTRWLTPDTLKNGTMALECDILDGVPNRRRGMGAIICLLDRKLYLRENLVALPLEYL